MRVSSGKARGKLRDILLKNESANTKAAAAGESKDSM
jgi:hypothetical protein